MKRYAIFFWEAYGLPITRYCTKTYDTIEEAEKFIESRILEIKNSKSVNTTKALIILPFYEI